MPNLSHLAFSHPVRFPSLLGLGRDENMWGAAILKIHLRFIKTPKTTSKSIFSSESIFSSVIVSRVQIFTVPSPTKLLS